MTRHIELTHNSLIKLRCVDERLMSYNIEMTEITGGTFWKAYTPEQIAGIEEFTCSGALSNFTEMADLMQYFPPIDLYNEKLRHLARQLGPVWIRVSGSWATKTYYDFEDIPEGRPPAGYTSVLTKEQWIGVLDFVKAVNGKLLVSVSNCAGDHPNGGPLDLSQTKKLFNFSHEYGVDIAAAEFMNEPNMLEFSGAPAGYTATDYARDQDIFNAWVRENYPDCLLVGPCTTGDPTVSSSQIRGFGSGIANLMENCATTGALMADTKVKLDVFSYHYYNGISERLALIAPMAHWNPCEAYTDAYLSVARDYARAHALLRDQYVPGGQLWVTESGDAGGGGNTWASTYLDILRTLNELGSFATVTDGVIFHNTLASSDYGFLQHGVFDPRPNYYAVLLWNTLMGSTVYDCEALNMENTHIYCHSRKDKKDGCVYLVINNSLSDTLSVRLPYIAEKYTLSGDGDIRSQTVCLNGKPLYLSENRDLPELSGEKLAVGTIELPPCSCTFFVM